MNLVLPLWRAVTVFRIATLGYAAVLMVNNYRGYLHPAGGWVVLAVMAAWTAVAAYAYRVPERRRWPLLGADLAVTGTCLLASRWVVPADNLTAGSATLTMAWVASPVLAWAIFGGRRLGAVAALVLGAIDITIRGGLTPVTLNGTVLLLLAGAVTGHMSRLAAEAEQQFQRATELEAATRERERLARRIHDSVLQVLALVQRRGAELGGDAAELGRLAGEQEATLRSLVAGGGTGGPAADGTGADGESDLRAILARYASPTVSIAAPATPVPLPAPAAAELAAAVGCALDNVRVHCGETCRAFVLVEDEGDAVVVTVRDEGPGIPDGRLAEAAAAGRLGVAQSIQGRVRDLGGATTITSEPGMGTEVELRVPRT